MAKTMLRIRGSAGGEVTVNPKHIAFISQTPSRSSTRPLARINFVSGQTVDTKETYGDLSAAFEEFLTSP